MQLNLPAFDYKIQRTAEGYYIFDVVRRKYVRLTPEEWTRQHFVHHLINQLGYPKSLIKLERGIRYSHHQRRPDIVVYNRSGKPWMLVECKAPQVDLSMKILEQLARYNPGLQAQLLVMTNGIEHCCWRVSYDPFSHELLQEIPAFDSLAKLINQEQ